MDNLHGTLIEFQIDRLKEDYADVAAQPENTALAKFFFEDVYATRDKVERDRSIRKLHGRVRETLGEETVLQLEEVIRLNELTDRLDLAVVKKFTSWGITDSFSHSEYEEAYFLCDNYTERVEQIDLILSSLKYFHGLSKYRTIGIGLKLLWPYAKLKGAEVLYSFLSDGYKAFRSVKDIDPFYKVVKHRELSRLDRIYSLGQRVPPVGELRRRARDMGIKDAQQMDARTLMRTMAQWA